MAKRILLVDRDQAFGTVMLEALVEAGAGQYEVQLAGTATTALTALRDQPFDLAILDLGVVDIAPQTTIRGMRMLRPNLPVLIIPLDGTDVPPDLAPLGVQGTLHKIFFRDGLAERLQSALGAAPPPRPPAPELPATAPLRAPVAAPAVPGRTAPELKLGRVAHEEIAFHLRRLAGELAADAVLFTYGGQLVASAGVLPRARMAELAAALAETWQSLHRLTGLAGETEDTIQALVEGKARIVYAISVGPYGAIAVATPAGTSPGAIRLRAREAAGAIESLIS